MRKASAPGHRQAGFTLIEIVLALLVAGVLMAFFADSLLNLKKENEIAVTKQRLEQISDALRRYAAYNGVLPCPANRMLASTATGSPETNADQNYGVAHTTCTSGARSGTVSTGNVRIGMLPVKTLNLPPDYAIDGWQTRFIYAVTENMTTGSYNFGTPRVDIMGHNNNVAFAVVSVGKDREGGFRMEGHTVNTADLNCNDTPGLDSENCDDDRTFAFYGPSYGNNASYFDDYIVFRNLPIPKNTAFPPGAVLAFNLSACPGPTTNPEWVPYTAANGRAIMGATPAGAPAFTNSAPNASPRTGYTGQNFNTIGKKGGSATRIDVAPAGSQFFNMPPYLDLIYCRKT